MRIAWVPQPAKPVVEHWSIEAMVHGYERLIESTYARKTLRRVGWNCVNVIAPLIMHICSRSYL